MFSPIRVELFGALRVVRDDLAITRFPTQKTGSLLGFLAYHLDRAHPREVLIEMLWPGKSPEAGRASLSMALTSLRRQLEPPDVPFGFVVQASRFSVGLNPASVNTDVAEFVDLLRRAESSGGAERAALLSRALDLNRGELLNGYYDDWLLPEQRRMSSRYLAASISLARELNRVGDIEAAVDVARRAIARDRTCEEVHCLLVSLLARCGDIPAAERAWADMAAALRSELGAEPSPEAADLLRRLKVAPIRKAPPPARSAPPAASAYRSASAPAPVPPAPSLPVPFTRLFGREHEIAELSEMLGRSAGVAQGTLITLIGPGGTGKTRLAIEIGRALWSAYSGRVWFAALADVRDPHLIGDAVCAAMRLAPGHRDDPLERISAAASSEPALLVADNMEHIAAAGALFLAALRVRAPGLAILVTSRRRLAIQGERLFSVRPLATPGASVPSAARAMAYPSVRLFVDRAQAVRPDFQVTARNCGAVSRLCSQLDGIPLALELAASRSQTLTPDQILVRLDADQEVLRDRRARSGDRHRSLNAAIEWSVGMLSPDLRRFFLGLGLLRGAFDADAAERVCARPDALELLTQLRERSLVTTEESAGEMRFRLLQTIREYAVAAFEPAERAKAERRHTACFLSRVEAAEEGLLGAGQLRAVQRLELDLDNVREAMQRSASTGDCRTMARFAAALGRFWWIQARLQEGSQWLSIALQCTDSVPLNVRAKVLHWAGTLAWARDRHNEAIDLHTQALAIHRRRRDHIGAARSLGSLGNIARQQGHDVEARRCYEESLVMFRKAGDQRGEATSLLNLGTMHDSANEPEPALAAYVESLRLYEQLGDLHGAAFALANAAPIVCGRGDYASALDLARRSLRIRQDLRDEAGLLTILAVLGNIALAQGAAARAVTLFTASAELHAAKGLEMKTLFGSELSQSLTAARGRLTESEFDAAQAAGRSLSLEAAVDLALQDGPA